MRLLKSLFITGIILLYSLSLSWSYEIEREEKEPLYLSVYEVLSLAVLNNFDVQLNLYDRWIKDTDLDEARSIYDTSLSLTGDYEYNKSKKPTIILGKVSHTGFVSGSLSKKLITGTDLFFDYKNERMSTDSAFTALNPYYESTFEMKFTQPLLKNFFGMNDWGRVRVTKIDVYNFSLETLDKIEETLADVEKAYWDVVLAVQLVEVGKDMLKRAEEFYEINKKKRKIGTSEVTDLLAAEANMEQRKIELDLEENALKTTVNNLRYLINHPETDRYILPADEIQFSVRNANLADSLKNAFNHRRDYARAEKDIKAKKINFNMKRNSRWPELDFEGSLKLNGLGPVDRSAVAKAFTGENPVYKAIVTFTIPFEDNHGKSEYDAAKYEKAKALLELKKTEKLIVTEIDDNVRDVNVNKDAARKRINIEELQREKLEAEQRFYRMGRSDSDRIVRFQEDLLRARIQALRALRSYKDSTIDLYVAENTYLRKRRLTIK